MNNSPMYECSPAGCKNKLCPRCAVRNSNRLKKIFLEWLSSFEQLSFVTLTINQNIFSSGQEAFDFLRKCRCIRLTLERMNKNKLRWFYVIEFRNGFPHVHVCVDAELDDINMDAMLQRWNLFAKRRNAPTFGNIHAKSGNLSAQSRHR